MKTIGFVISKKEKEKRRALLPQDIVRIKNKSSLYFEKGYGEVLNIGDEVYSSLGCNIVSRREVLQQDIICDPKIGDAEYLIDLNKHQTIFGWIHAVQNRDITDTLISRKLTAYAWEDMYESGRHVFWRNNEIAGEAAIMQSFECYGIMPYNTKVAVLGKGNVARGAMKILTLLGADVVVYDRKTEKLFQNELDKYDVIVNGILWDTSRNDHIIYKSDLKRMKKGAMIIDISCDRNGGIETSIPTTIEDPVFTMEGIMHYAVDHTPSLFYKTSTIDISKELYKYVDELIESKARDVLSKALIIDKGVIVGQRIIEFQKREQQHV